MSFDHWAPAGLGLRLHTVGLKPHDRAWGEAFDEASRRIFEATEVTPARVLHVGSTAVPDLRAKPILDVDLVLDASYDTERVVSGLEDVGFLDRGETPGDIGRLVVREIAPEVRAIHVHILGFPSENSPSRSFGRAPTERHVRTA